MGQQLVSSPSDLCPALLGYRNLPPAHGKGEKMQMLLHPSVCPAQLGPSVCPSWIPNADAVPRPNMTGAKPRHELREVQRWEVKRHLGLVFQEGLRDVALASPSVYCRVPRFGPFGSCGFCHCAGIGTCQGK
ncbi:hypothetical protein Q9966_006124 [Columba livia]|nr:hypothetical protein Q9966_006124 [Columba livia]